MCSLTFVLAFWKYCIVCRVRTRDARCVLAAAAPTYIPHSLSYHALLCSSSPSLPHALPATVWSHQYASRAPKARHDLIEYAAANKRASNASHKRSWQGREISRVESIRKDT